MAKRIDTQARIEQVRLQEQGSSPATPSAGYSTIYAKANGLYLVNDDGQHIGPFITGTATASGRTLIAESTPTSTGTISFTSIPGTYKNLVIEYAARSTASANESDIKVQFNGDATDANYRHARIQLYGAGTIEGEEQDATKLGKATAANSPANSFAIGLMEIPQYANANFNKIGLGTVAYRYDTSSVQLIKWVVGMEWENVAAITQINLVLSTGDFASNSVFRLYGEN